MAAKKTTKTDEKKPAAKGKTAAAKGADKKAPAAKKAPRAAAPAAPRGPLAVMKAKFGTKDDLVRKVSDALAVGDQDPDALGARLKKASNKQLMRLAAVVETVNQKYGSREKLIATLSNTVGKAKDKDYLAKLGSFSLPRLLDLARSAERRARA